MTNTTQPEPAQCTCGDPADGLSWGMCQDCWERYCAGLFWRTVAQLQDVVKEDE